LSIPQASPTPPHTSYNKRNPKKGIESWSLNPIPSSRHIRNVTTKEIPKRELRVHIIVSMNHLEYTGLAVTTKEIPKRELRAHFWHFSFTLFMNHTLQQKKSQKGN
jgi:hypothetical protein